eukprot:620808-Pleurochrysis_carterae.AAC.2
MTLDRAQKTFSSCNVARHPRCATLQTDHSQSMRPLRPSESDHDTTNGKQKNYGKRRPETAAVAPHESSRNACRYSIPHILLRRHDGHGPARVSGGGMPLCTQHHATQETGSPVTSCSLPGSFMPCARGGLLGQYNCLRRQNFKIAGAALCCNVRGQNSRHCNASCALYGRSQLRAAALCDCRQWCF